MALHCLKKRLQVLDLVLGRERMGWGEKQRTPKEECLDF